MRERSAGAWAAATMGIAAVIVAAVDATLACARHVLAWGLWASAAARLTALWLLPMGALAGLTAGARALARRRGASDALTWIAGDGADGAARIAGALVATAGAAAGAGAAAFVAADVVHESVFV